MHRQVIVVVGAGVCGLSFALTAARRGFRCIVLEKRQDRPFVPALPDEAQSESEFWGTRARNVYLDLPALQALQMLGVQLDDLPRLKILDISWGEGLPSTRLTLADRVIDPGGLHLTAEQLILQRDWIAIPTLSQIECALRQIVDQNEQIELRFGSAVSRISDDSGCALVALNDGSVVKAELVVIADGGGADSLSQRCGVDRKVVTSDSFSIVALAVDPADRIIGHPTTQAISASSLNGGGWSGIVSNGEIVIATVNKRRQEALSDTALHYARSLGLTGKVLEGPMEITAPLDRAQRLLIGSRTLLAGDAAARGSPTFGLGAQFGVLFAQLIDRSVLKTGLDKESLEVSLREYEALATDAIDRRMRFEEDCLSSLDQILTGERSVPGLFSREELLSRCEVERFDYKSNQQGGVVDFSVRFDFASPSAAATMDLAPFRQFGICRLRGRLPVRWTDKGIHATLSDGDRLIIETGSETMAFFRGEVTWTRERAAWTLRVAQPSAQRWPLFERRGLQKPYVCDYEEVFWRFPDGVAEQAVGELSRNMRGLTRRGVTRTLRAELREGAELQWGPFRTQVAGDPVLEMSMQQMQSGCVRISMVLLSGNFHLVSSAGELAGAQFAPGWIRSSAALAPGMMRLWDPWLAIGSRAIRRIDCELNIDTQSALVTFNGFDIAPVPLTRRSFDALQHSLYGPEAMAEMFLQSAGSIIRLSME